MKIKDGDIIVFAGDSTTDADKNATGDGLGNGYVKLVRDALFAFRPSENSAWSTRASAEIRPCTF